jgi:hypothetical protein
MGMSLWKLNLTIIGKTSFYCFNHEPSEFLKNNDIIFFFQEYETLTNKIHELQVKEEDLLAKMPNEEEEDPPLPPSSTISSSGGVVQPNVPNPLPSPKPVHGIIKAYLPNEQFSLVKKTFHMVSLSVLL